MNANSENPRPLRAGILDSVADADLAVAELLAAGFTGDQITAVCSERAVKEHFKSYEHQDPAGEHTRRRRSPAALSEPRWAVWQQWPEWSPSAARPSWWAAPRYCGPVASWADWWAP